MFKHKPSDNDVLLEAVIGDQLTHLLNTTDYGEDNAPIVEQLVALNAIQNTKKDRISRDVLLTVGANLLGIVVIVGHERAHVVTSKALTFVKTLV